MGSKYYYDFVNRR